MVLAVSVSPNGSGAAEGYDDGTRPQREQLWGGCEGSLHTFYRMVEQESGFVLVDDEGIQHQESLVGHPSRRGQVQDDPLTIGVGDFRRLLNHLQRNFELCHEDLGLPDGFRNGGDIFRGEAPVRARRHGDGVLAVRGDGYECGAGGRIRDALYVARVYTFLTERGNQRSAEVVVAYPAEKGYRSA